MKIYSLYGSTYTVFVLFANFLSLCVCSLDIGPALLEATKRMQSLGVGNVIDTPVKQLVEADSDSM